LVTPKDSSIRPTTDKTKNAIFSSLFDKVYGARVLDLFCGTGAFGLEALSRGASHCVFVDIMTDYVKKNCEMAERGTYQVVKGKVETVIERFRDKFDIIFLDPPYGQVNAQELLELVNKHEILANEGILIYEESVRSPFIIPEEHYELLNEKKYGDTKIYYLSGIS